MFLSVKRPGLVQEVTLDDENGQPLLRFASAYGFRNIQTLVQKIKRKQCPYDYVEVMACPSGCVNGGGQPKHPNIDPKELLSKIETIHTQDVVMRDPELNPVIGQFLNVDLDTEYEKVMKTSHRTVTDW